jgi:ADP-ribosylation factor-like protein 13B
MGNCFSSSPVESMRVEELTIAVFGLDNAGKTCLVRSLCGNFCFNSVPSVGFGHESFSYNSAKVKVYDLGGISNFRNVWERFYADIWGCIYVIDASDPDRFEESRQVLQQMLGHKMMKGKPYVIVANKQDRDGAFDGEGIRKEFKLNAKVPIFSASVTKVKNKRCNSGVSRSVDDLISQILNRYNFLEKKRKSDLAEQEKIEAKERSERWERMQKRRAEEMQDVERLVIA